MSATDSSTHTTATGGIIIAGTQRPDGTWRKARKVKSGYVPQELQPKFVCKALQAHREQVRADREAKGLPPPSPAMSPESDEPIEPDSDLVRATADVRAKKEAARRPPHIPEWRRPSVAAAARASRPDAATITAAVPEWRRKPNAADIDKLAAGMARL